MLQIINSDNELSFYLFIGVFIIDRLVEKCKRYYYKKHWKEIEIKKVFNEEK